MTKFLPPYFRAKCIKTTESGSDKWPPEALKSLSRIQSRCLVVNGEVIVNVYSLCEGMSQFSARAACDVSWDV